MTTTRSLLVVGLTVVVLLTAGCNGDDGDLEVANPASVFCVEQGGEVEIVDEEDGQVGYCLLPGWHPRGGVGVLPGEFSLD